MWCLIMICLVYNLLVGDLPIHLWKRRGPPVFNMFRSNSCSFTQTAAQGRQFVNSAGAVGCLFSIW